MSLTELVIAALALWELLELWHHGEVFARHRERLQTATDWTSRLLRCPFCLAPWAALLYVLPGLLLEADAARHLWLWTLLAAWRGLVYALAVARLADLGNDLTHACCRTPRGVADTIRLVGGGTGADLRADGGPDDDLLPPER